MESSAKTILIHSDPDWFFYLSKELSHVFTTYLKDLRLLKQLLATHDHSYVLPVSIVNQTEMLTTQINTLMRDRELWEDTRHGLEIISICLRYFQSNEEAYITYVSKLEELLLSTNEDYSCYLPVEALITRPVLLCQYYVERICFECRCCGAGELHATSGGGSANLRKVNFSPVLDKRSIFGVKKEPGDTSLDAPVLHKLHSIHLLLNKILEPYHKSKLTLLSVSKVQELTREMDGFCGITSGCKKVDVVGLLGVTGEFIRQGILLKLNKRKGLQNRIFFLFRDTLIYGTRVSSTQGFRLHGVICTRNMELLDTTITSIPNSFSVVIKSSELHNDPTTTTTEDPINANEKILILAAFTQQDHASWVASLSQAISLSVSSSPDTPLNQRSLASRIFNSSSEELINNNVKTASSDEISGSSNLVSAQHNRSNALSHVCWHRNISICAGEVVEKEAACLSGPLLRKFKNSHGWQKLWLCFAHSCLYFYKSASDTTPLASLPLLGYKVELLSEVEKSQVQKENCFKLAFKSHIYYFRAESRYTFTRWISVLRSAMIENNSTTTITNITDEQLQQNNEKTCFFTN